MQEAIWDRSAEHYDEEIFDTLRTIGIRSFAAPLRDSYNPITPFAISVVGWGGRLNFLHSGQNKCMQ